MSTLAIYGSGGLGREVLDLVNTIHASSPRWEQIIFINDFKKTASAFIRGIDIRTFEEFQEQFTPNTAKVVIAVGEPSQRKILREKVTASGYMLQTLIHPQTFIGANTTLGDGKGSTLL